MFPKTLTIHAQIDIDGDPYVVLTGEIMDGEYDPIKFKAMPWEGVRLLTEDYFYIQFNDDLIGTLDDLEEVRWSVEKSIDDGDSLDEVVSAALRKIGEASFLNGYEVVVEAS